MAVEPYIVFGKPHIGEEEIAEVTDCLRTAWLGTGPRVAAFRDAFKEYVHAPYAEPVHSCTAALFLAHVGLRIGKGDSVITSPMSFVATANAIRHAGATPLFADVELESGLLDPAQVERVLEEDCDIDDADGRPIHRDTGTKVRAILPVHFHGRVVDINAFRALCKRFNLYLIEDAAHAIETTYGDEKIGATADATCFSFYATKNVCTGEGGMITTPHQEVADRIRVLALHGLSKDAWKRFSDSGYQHYMVEETGWKHNMMDLQAALGIHQLARVEEMLVKREAHWKAYVEEFKELEEFGIRVPGESDLGRHARHLFALRIPKSHKVNRDQFLSGMHSRGIGTGVHYLSMSVFPAYKDNMNVPVPNSETFGDETASLPLGGALTEDERRRVSRAVLETLLP